MLPKVTTHILNTTSRVAAAVHNQTSTLRNVFQLQTGSGPSTAGPTTIGPWNGNGSSSRGGGHGPGPGGAKQNTGSRFYPGFTGPVRTVTQANAVTSQDGSFIQHDDNQEEPSSARPVALQPTKGHRTRRSSQSMGHLENLSVLKTVQIHTRSRHAFAQAPSGKNDVAKSTGTTSAQKTVQPSRRLITRRNSTSSQASDISPDPTVPLSQHSTDAVDPAAIPLPRSPTTPAASLSASEPSKPQTLQHPYPPQHLPGQNDIGHVPKLFSDHPTSAYLALKAARDTNDPAMVADAVRHFRQTTVNPNVREFNMALEALVATRKRGEPLTLIMDTYNDMIRASLIPTINTYSFLIQALIDRDSEVQKLIRVIQMRMNRRSVLTGELEASDQEKDEEKIELLQKEENVSSALALFETISSIDGTSRLTIETYHALLRGCASRGQATRAAQIFAKLGDHPMLRVSVLAYKYLIQAHAIADEIQNAEMAFDEFRRICKEDSGRLDWEDGARDPPRSTAYSYQKVATVWAQMIDAYFQVGMPDKAVALLQLMLDAPPLSREIPRPFSSTFTSILVGFCNSGDMETALAWFNRLLELSHGSGQNPFLLKAFGSAVRPDKAAYSTMIEALALRGMVDELNTVFELMLVDGPKDDIYPTISHRVIVFSANMKRLLSLDAAEVEKTLHFLADKVIPVGGELLGRSVMVRKTWETCIDHGLFQLGTNVMLNHAESLIRPVNKDEISSAVTAMDTAQEHLTAFSARLYESTQGAVPFSLILKLWRFTTRIKDTPPFADGYMVFALHSYGLARREGLIPKDMKPSEWGFLLRAAVQVESAEIDGHQHLLPFVQDNAFEGIVSLVEDMEARGVVLGKFGRNLVNYVVKVVFLKYDTKDLKAITSQLGPEFQGMEHDSQAVEAQSPLSESTLVYDQNTDASSPTFAGTPPESVSLDTATTFVDEKLSAELDRILNRPKSLEQASDRAYHHMMAAIATGRLPNATTIGRVTQCLGRTGHLDKVKEVYAVAQRADNDLGAWIKIEDSMIIALAHAGEIDAAHAHRKNILDNDCAPSADAYGILIHAMKDTTDDTSNAMALFQESVSLKVNPNLYLYNNIISKLSKARKADYALQLFREMSPSGIHPSSITYGAVIGACARVGDVQSAETLFMEMEQARNFKPRVPPYNTMMQLYTTTKPNRERALYYYEKMKRAYVAPTAHTYKLLMDAYGSIEPVDIDAMEQVFASLKHDPSVAVQGVHFASLINAYGCVCKDLDKAISIFESIPSHPRAQSADAVVYEAMINAFVAHKRTDLIPEYVNKMKERGVNMTAYIANFLIKGYANVGDLEQARAIFEGLADPAQGVAASGNHVPHSDAVTNGAGAVEDKSNGARLVYREPSTWEAMVRAELGAGQRARALDLLERLKARKYPEAVYNRISGIMVDHSMVF
ncbi:hypothetical protein APHAL10511_008499 [Amanita phalloides]|nr:hypothetical protein APHAL10511_008499 [Amanita phalloides]